MKMLRKSWFLGKQKKGQWESMVHSADARRYYAEAQSALCREHREHSGDAHKENLGMNCRRPGGGHDVHQPENGGPQSHVDMQESKVE